MKSISYKKNFR